MSEEENNPVKLSSQNKDLSSHTSDISVDFVSALSDFAIPLSGVVVKLGKVGYQYFVESHKLKKVEAFLKKFETKGLILRNSMIG